MTALTELATRSIGWRRSKAAKPTTFLLLALDQRAAGIDIIPGFNKLRYRFAKSSDLEKIRDEHSAPPTATDPEYHQEGDRCLLQLSGDELVGLSWVTSTPLAYLSHGVYYNLPDDTCHTYNAHTSLAYNATMCRAHRDQAVLRLSSGEGKRRLLTAIDESALPDVMQVREYGYELVGHMHVLARRGRLRISLDVREDYWCFVRRT